MVDDAQPVGARLEGWTPPPFPPPGMMRGRFCDVTPLVVPDAAALWEAYADDRDGRNWTYLSHGPYEQYGAFARWVEDASRSTDPQFYAVRRRGGASATGAPAPAAGGPSVSPAAGVAAYLRITPSAATIEVGHIHFSPRLQRTPAATEAMYLMMRRAFELGYRRYEWKCDALNTPSRRAARRLGFSYEDTFRQHMVVKGHNRDTAWYACLDRDWPALRAAFEQWLAPDNFEDDGRQRRSLSSLTAPLLADRG